MMGGQIDRAFRLVEHFAEVPLFLIGFGRTREGSGIYPAFQNAMPAARAEGIGSTLTGFLQSYLISGNSLSQATMFHSTLLGPSLGLKHQERSSLCSH
jgi:hypothetical protein